MLVYEIHQTKYRVMSECDMDWPPWRLLISFALLGGMENLSDNPIRDPTMSRNHMDIITLSEASVAKT